MAPIRVLEVVFDITKKVPFFVVALLKRFIYIAAVFLFAMILIWLRSFILESAALLNHHVKDVTFYINYVVFILDVVVNAMRLAFAVAADIIHIIIDAYNDVAHFLHIHSISNIPWQHISGFTKLADVTTTEVQNDINAIISVCPTYDSAGFIIRKLIYTYVAPYTCHLTLAAYPSEVLFVMANGVFGWSFPGSALPRVDVPGYNCGFGSDTVYFSCVAMGVGYIVRILVPFIVLELFLSYFGVEIFKLLAALLKTSFSAALLPFQLIHESIVYLGL